MIILPLDKRGTQGTETTFIFTSTLPYFNCTPGICWYFFFREKIYRSLEPCFFYFYFYCYFNFSSFLNGFSSKYAWVNFFIEKIKWIFRNFFNSYRKVKKFEWACHVSFMTFFFFFNEKNINWYSFNFCRHCKKKREKNWN